LNLSLLIVLAPEEGGGCGIWGPAVTRAPPCSVYTGPLSVRALVGGGSFLTTLLRRRPNLANEGEEGGGTDLRGHHIPTTPLRVAGAFAPPSSITP
jgi:hypothetical protein